MSTVKMCFNPLIEKRKVGETRGQKKRSRASRLLALQEFQITPGICALITNGQNIVADREVFHFDSHLVLVYSFSLHVKNIPDDVVHSKFRLTGNGFFKGNMQVLGSRVGI